MIDHFARAGSTSDRLKRCRVGAFSLFSLLLLGIAAPANPDPYQIYDRARALWRSQTYPDDIQYRTTIHVSEGNKDEQNHYNGEVSTGSIRVDSVSDEELAAPHTATGINFKVVLEFSWNKNAGGNVGTFVTDAHRKERSPDYFGVPLLSPEYSFGLEPLRPKPTLPQTVGGLESALPTIATVSASAQPYDITLVGAQAVDGFTAYHLRLHPRQDPERYRLRELWIDTDSFAVLKLVTQGNFTGPPMNAVPWEVTFQEVGGETYIDTEKADAPLVFRGDRTLTSAVVSFTDIRVADSKLPVLPFIDSGQILREP